MQPLSDLLVSDSARLNVSPSLPVPRNVLDAYDAGRLAWSLGVTVDQYQGDPSLAVHWRSGFEYARQRSAARSAAEAAGFTYLVTRKVIPTNEKKHGR
jgi:hypothetical protein